MAQGSDLLDYKTARAKTAPGHYRDGRGLCLQVSVWGTKSWVMRYTVRGRTRGMGLGSYEEVSLKEARNKVERLRVVVREGRDPFEERRALNVTPDVPKVVTSLHRAGLNANRQGLGRCARSDARSSARVVR